MNPLPLGARLVAGAFATSGVIHLVRPQVFEPLIPPQLGHQRELVLVSGVAELACAAGLLVPATRPIAAPASAALLIGVFPGNVQMSLDAVRAAVRRPSPARVAVAAGSVARLPGQWPLIRWAWSARHA